jgi:CDP-diacylglycerol--glycerol-3-phosphate 3-phosphatidyltransferase
MTVANRVTIFRILLVPVFIALMYIRFPYAHYVAAAVFIIGALSDMLDGYLARSMNQITTFGKFIDPIADKLLVMSAFIVLVGLGKMHELFAVVFVAREFIVSGFRLVAASQNNVIAAGWLGKIKTVTQIVAVVLLILDNFPFALIGLPMDMVALWVSLVFTVWSAADYLIKNRETVSFDVEGDGR